MVSQITRISKMKLTFNSWTSSGNSPRWMPSTSAVLDKNPFIKIVSELNFTFTKIHLPESTPVFCKHCFRNIARDCSTCFIVICIYRNKFKFHKLIIFGLQVSDFQSNFWRMYPKLSFIRFYPGSILQSPDSNFLRQQSSNLQLHLQTPNGRSRYKAWPQKKTPNNETFLEFT